MLSTAAHAPLGQVVNERGGERAAGSYLPALIGLCVCAARARMQHLCACSVCAHAAFARVQHVGVDVDSVASHPAGRPPTHPTPPCTALFPLKLLRSNKGVLFTLYRDSSWAALGAAIWLRFWHCVCGAVWVAPFASPFCQPRASMPFVCVFAFHRT